MNVLVIHPSYPPGWLDGGPVTTVSELAIHMAKAGAQVTVLTSNRNARGEQYCVTGEQMRDGVRVFYCSRWWPWRYSITPGHLRLVLRWFPWADVVCVMSVFNFTSVYSLLAAIWFRGPVVVSPRGNLSPKALSKTGLLKRLHGALIERPLLRKALFVHCTSSLDKMWAEQYAPGATCAIIPNGVNFTQAAPLRNCHDSEAPRRRRLTRILFLGRFHPIKNIEALIAAFLSLEHPALRLILVGAGEDQYSTAIRQRCNGKDNIRIFRFTKRAWKRRLLALSDVVVLPSFSENFGNVVLEAIAARVPVLVSSEAGAADIVRKTGAGIVVAPERQAIAKALEAIITDLPRYRQAASEARTLLAAYEWPSVAARFLRACSHI
jgi:glycosyltransferase involved in cell wall biosynthesis